MTPLELLGAVEALLDEDDRYTRYTAQVPGTPGGAYVVLYPTPGNVRTARLSASHLAQQWDIRIVCVGRTATVCLNTAKIIRDKLTGVRLDPSLSASPLNEVNDGALLVKGEDVDHSDVRFSFTLHYRMYTQRS